MDHDVLDEFAANATSFRDASTVTGSKPPPAAAGEGRPQAAAAQLPPAPAIEANGIGRRNPKGSDWLIRDINLVLNHGERLAVLGPSGAGKTLLLRSLALLDPLDAGKVLWQSHPLPDGAVPGYRGQVIYVPQRRALLDGSVEDNLRLPFLFHAHRARQFDRVRVLDLLDDMGRGAEFLGMSCSDLSGGEAQLVTLVRAIQLDPAVLLLDEPTASLDQPTVRAVERVVDRWFTARHGQRALIWVSHDPQQASRVTDRTLHLRSGRLESGD